MNGLKYENYPAVGRGNFLQDYVFCADFRFLGIIHLVRKQIFRKNLYFLSPVTHTYVTSISYPLIHTRMFIGKICVRTEWMIPCRTSSIDINQE